MGYRRGRGCCEVVKDGCLGETKCIGDDILDCFIFVKEEFVAMYGLGFPVPSQLRGKDV